MKTLLLVLIFIARTHSVKTDGVHININISNGSKLAEGKLNRRDLEISRKGQELHGSASQKGLGGNRFGGSPFGRTPFGRTPFGYSQWAGAGNGGHGFGRGNGFDVGGLGHNFGFGFGDARGHYGRSGGQRWSNGPQCLCGQSTAPPSYKRCKKMIEKRRKVMETKAREKQRMEHNR